MDLLNFIKEYQPFNEKEAEYKKSFIQFLEYFPEHMWAVRENLIGHLTSTAWVVNKDRTKVLFAYHNIFDSWAWLGGHADGDLDLLNVAVKEAKEESGITNVKILKQEPIAIEALYVQPHVKRDKFVPDHLHYNFTYLLEADENEALEYRPDESSAVAWIAIEDLFNKVTEEHMKDTYQRIIDKVKSMNI